MGHFYNKLKKFHNFFQEAKLKKFDVAAIKFEDIFAGPPPVFKFSEVKKKPAKKPESKPESRNASPAPTKKKEPGIS